MIITCPECATRYDLEDERFQPHGRSVRCTACGESWFVPAPEPIDALPTRETPSYREDRPSYRDEGRMAERDADRRDARDEPGDDLRAERPAAPNFQFSDDNRDPREAEVTISHADDEPAPRRDDRDRANPLDRDEIAADFTEGDDDVLFDSPASKSRPDDYEHDVKRAMRDREDETPPKGWRKGKQFFVEDTDDETRDEPGDDPRPFFAKHFSRSKDEAETPHRATRDRADNRADGRAEERRTEQRRDREAPRFESDEDIRRDRDYRDTQREAEPRGDRDYEMRYQDADDYDVRDYEDDIIPGDATIVDADWEAVDEGTGPRFGRRLREERRRATALARLEDVRRFEPQSLDDEFFRSLHVTPRELERAIRKARRRAESRDKNRMTPWRAFGWSAWVAAVAGAAYAVVAYRDEIVKAAPSAADAYAVVGIETDPFGLKIENVRHRLAMSTGGAMIEISGDLRNSGADALNAPLLQAEALGPRGELLARWTFKPEEPAIAGGNVVQFTTRNAAPDGVVEVALSFAPAQGAVPAH